MRKPFISVLLFSALLNISAAANKSEQEAPFSISVVAEDSKATIKITGYIHEWGNANSVDLGVKIDALNEAGYNDCTVYINSKGGQTWEANEIVNALRTFKGKLHGECGAMAFSAATYIACKLDTFKVHSNSQFMWHEPQATLKGTYDKIKNDLKVVADTKADYLKVYAAKTGKTEKELDELWAKGDQWLMGQEIVDFGFADGLIKSDAPVSAADVVVLEAVGAPVVPVATAEPTPPSPTSKNDNNKSEIDMKINPTTIGLEANATEAEINAKLVELKASADTAKTLQEEKEQKEKADRTAEIKAVLDKGQADRKFDTGMRAEFEGMMAESDAGFERGKKIIDGMSAVGDVDGNLDLDATTIEARKDWTLEKWQEEDPEGLQARAEKDEKWFEGLVAAK